MRLKFASMIALAATLAAACANDPASQTTRKLRSAFGDDAKQIEVRIDGSRATLTGTVSQRSTQELSEEVARSIPGVTSVDNRITGPSSRGLGKLRDEAVDAALELSVKGALVADVGSNVADALEAEAADGVVSLRGRVSESSVHRHAVEIAGRVEGVRRVIDLVEVGEPKTP
ncbi:MAG: BON domain-containing protein [Thermoanaerobaculia bacterium]|jgi:osmotically-inducible protein OsmY